MMLIKYYLIALPLFLVMDLVWIGIIAKDFYRVQIGALMKADVNWIAAVFFYVLFITGLVLFVILPSMEKQSLVHALVFGALFGLVCYATYDLTNLALAKNWPVLVTIVDLVWGASVSAFVSGTTYYIVSKFL